MACYLKKKLQENALDGGLLLRAATGARAAILLREGIFRFRRSELNILIIESDRPYHHCA